VSWIFALRKEKFDLVVDLRNSAIPVLVGARHATTPFLKRTPGQHMRHQHLRHLKSIYSYEKESDEKYSLYISEEFRREVDRMIQEEIGGDNLRYVVVAPGAADRGKQWFSTGFAKVCDHLIEKYNIKTVFVGDAKDRKKAQDVIKKMQNHGINLSGRVNLIQLAGLLKKSSLLITNDSAPLHMASYLDIPVIGLFGSTDPNKYGPWGKYPYYIKKGEGRSSAPEECMRAIKVEDVIGKVEEIKLET
jgi:ADP-heptose:LPS heptosyltransferase